MFLGKGVAHKSLSKIIGGVDGDLGDQRSVFIRWAQALAGVEWLLVLWSVDVGALGHRI